MNHVLLLGAGFSRNWGGWLANEAFEYLLGCPEIMRSDYLRPLLWQHKRKGGFESALAEVQEAWAQEFQRRQLDAPYFSQSKDNLDKFQSAIERMFQDMNKGFSQLSDLEFQTDKQFMVRTFLVRFDAIFTLNQDLLLEKHYLNQNVQLASNGKWAAWQIPGMREAPYLSPKDSAQGPVTKWVPENSSQFKVADRHQPYFKLHGSSEWRDGSDSEMLIVGGNKDRAILSHEILKWYYSRFWNELLKPATRLMIIGYSFGDDHINKAILNAATKGQLQIFIVDPAGVDVVRHTNLTISRPLYVPNELETTLQPIIIGASRRQMREIFGTNTGIEHGKVMQFFN